MTTRIIGLLAIWMAFESFGQSGTNTPFQVGERVSIRTSSQSLTGALEVAESPEWVLLRQDSGEQVALRTEALESVARVTGDPATSRTDAARWKLRSRHFIYGMPELTHDKHNFLPHGYVRERSGVSVLVREGFVVGHVDRFKAPLWVSMRWTREDLQQSLAEQEMPRNFRPDPELPEYARATAEYRGSVTGYDRGHMARHADNRAWGRKNSDAGCLMSNIAPQRATLNRTAWLSVEDAHRFIVAPTSNRNIDAVWIISGCVYAEQDAVEYLANGVGIPTATFKVVAWFDARGAFHARGYVLPQNATAADPVQYLAPIREIEERTGLDFFPELERQQQDVIETAAYTNLWGE